MQPSLARGVVGRINLVQHVGRFLAKHAEAVGEAGRDPQQQAVLVTEFDAKVPAERG